MCAIGGRPDVMKLVKEAYASWGAEVVFITSNYQGNKEIMEGCKEAGIPAFVRRFLPSLSLGLVDSLVNTIFVGYSVGFLSMFSLDGGVFDRAVSTLVRYRLPLAIIITTIIHILFTHGSRTFHPSLSPRCIVGSGCPSYLGLLNSKA